jgi:hypothetical protein
LGAAVGFEININNYYRNQLTESLRNTNSLLENSTKSCRKEKYKESTTKINIKPTSKKTMNQQVKKAIGQTS